MMDEIASGIMELDIEYDDAPGAIGIGKKKYPLGRYLHQNLRKKLGRDPKTPETVLAEYDKKMQPLRETAAVIAPRGFKNFYLKTLLTEVNAGKVERLEGKYKRGRKRGNI